MTTVSISGLKAKLFGYIREIRRRGEVQVLDRGKPLARLAPPVAAGDRLDQTFVRIGLLRPGKDQAAAILDEPPIQLPTSLSAALMENRTDRLRA